MYKKDLPLNAQKLKHFDVIAKDGMSVASVELWQAFQSFGYKSSFEHIPVWFARISLNGKTQTHRTQSKKTMQSWLTHWETLPKPTTNI